MSVLFKKRLTFFSLVMSGQIMIFELEPRPWSCWTSLPLDKQQVTGENSHWVNVVYDTVLAVTLES